MRHWNATARFWLREEGFCLRTSFNLIESRTSENALLSNKIEIIFIIELITEKIKLSQASFHEYLKIWHINPKRVRLFRRDKSKREDSMDT